MQKHTEYPKLKQNQQSLVHL